MGTDEIDDFDAWSSQSGYVSLLQAEDRLRITRRALTGIANLIDSVQGEAATEATDRLHWIRKVPEAAVYSTEAEEYLEDQVLAVRSELPLMLYGTLIVYLFSLLESCLADCLEDVAATRKESPPKRVPHPKLEEYVNALATRNVMVEWSQETWDQLRNWRTKRNSIVHRLEAPTEAFSLRAGQDSNTNGSRR